MNIAIIFYRLFYLREVLSWNFLPQLLFGMSLRHTPTYLLHVQTILPLQAPKFVCNSFKNHLFYNRNIYF